MTAAIRELRTLGLDEELLDRLARSMGAESSQPLTEFQAEVLGDSRLTEPGSNLIVAGPTSAGKTLIAIVVAALTRLTAPEAKIVYVVPLRALVTEKAAELASVFRGARVLPVSSDYPRSEHFVRRGDWDIAVVVFEKLYQWLSESALASTVLPRLGLVILDELQIVGEPGRGERLEMVATLLRHFQKLQDKSSRLSFRILGMGVSREIAAGLGEWLSADVLPERRVPRPVPLFEAVLQRKKGWYVRDEESRAVLPAEEVPAAVVALLAGVPSVPLLVERAARAGFRTLVYCASRRDAVETARFLARRFQTGPIHSILLDELSQLEDSPIVDELKVLLHSRVGVHHGHMSPHERAIVEKGFRSRDTEPPISVLVATRTLGMGVNLPADLVVFRDVHTGQHLGPELSDGQPRKHVRKLTVAEYRNLAGRAGRLRPGLPADTFGLVVLYSKRGEWEGVAEELLNGEVEPLQSVLENPEFGWGAHHVAALSFHETFQRTGTSVERVNAILASSYSQVASGRLPDNVPSSVSRLEQLGIATHEGLTGAGRSVSRYGLSSDALSRLVEISGCIEQWWPQKKLALLYDLFETPELSKRLIPPTPFGGKVSEKDLRVRTREIRRYFEDYLDADELVAGSALARWLLGPRSSKPRNVDVSRFIKAVALRQWGEGVRPRQLNGYSTPELESELERSGHFVRRLRAAFEYMTVGQLGDAGEMATALVGAIRQLQEQIDISRDAADVAQVSREMWIWEQSMRFGVALDRVVIPVVVSYATNERLRRTSITELFEAMGRPRDPRVWAGRPAPTGIKQAVWASFQAGLTWWNEEAGTWQSGEREAGTIRQALDDVVASLPRPSAAFPAVATMRPRLVPKTPRPAAQTEPMLLAGSDQRSLTVGRLEAEARQRIARCKGRREALIALTLQELTSAPMLAGVRGFASPRNHVRPLWLVQVGDQRIQVGIWAGDLTTGDLSRGSHGDRGGPALLIVCGEISQDINLVPPIVRGIVSASAVFALCQWARHRPQDLAIARACITGQGAVMRNALEAFTPHEFQTKDKNG